MEIYHYLTKKFIVTLFLTLLITLPVKANKTYNIYLDADFTGTKVASLSIQQGINVALAEENYRIKGYQFNIITKDHKGNSLRSKRNLESFLADSNALLLFSGLHSPPLLAHKNFINNNRILVLNPWAAAGPITRATDKNNWIFRLSIDDSNAGSFISNHALQEGFNKPFLLLEDTGWGRSNNNTMTKALAANDIKPKGTTWFNWGLGINHAKILLRNAKSSGADVIFFVGNANEGKTFAQAMLALDTELQLPIRSHWGITGGDFAEVINNKAREQLDLQFIQTQFSFIAQPQSLLAQNVLLQTITMYPEINTANDIKAPTGFVHAYDLTKLLIAAIKQSGLTGDKHHDANAIKLALEHLEAPVQGLIKNYQTPYSPYTLDNINAHEALDEADYAMGYYQVDNSVTLLPRTPLSKELNEKN
ncbi:MAG: ABC transporter substrate-binding protein [Colwellia sp.]|nr:ABC transporter substrate-binding protein [Colwellia sp.]